jgi:hypothetical protein
MIEKGATTIWETWLGDASHSHPMFGSVCAWYYRSLGGIAPDPEQPGFKNTIIRPIPVSALSYVNCSYPSAYGTIRSNWKLVGEDYHLEITIPANSTATVYVLAENEQMVTENGSSLSGNKYVRFLRYEGQYAVYSVASGTYRFKSAGAAKLLQKTILPTPMIHPGDTLIYQSDSVLVNLTTDMADSKIYYTTDNTEPDTLATLFSKGFYVSKPVVIRSRAFLKGFESSFTSTSHIEFIDSTINGLNVKYYAGEWSQLPDFKSLPIVKKGTSFDFTLKKIFSEKDKFALEYEGKILIKKAGSYEFFIQSNDGSRLFLDNQVVVDHDGSHGADSEKSGKISLGEGLHDIKLQYFQAGGGMFLEVRYAGPETEKQSVPATILFQK